MADRQKTGGRTKGTPNKVTADIRERFELLVSDNLDVLKNDLNSLEPKDRVRCIIELSKFVLPTLRAVDNTIKEATFIKGITFVDDVV